MNDYDEDGVCPPCQRRAHALCVGRTEPDCDLRGDRYVQTNYCACETCEEDDE